MKLFDPADTRLQSTRCVWTENMYLPLEGKGKNRVEQAGRVGLAEVLKLPATDSGRVSLPDLLDELGRRNLISLLIEGGGEVHAAFFAEGLVDKIYAYIAPKLIGGKDAPGPLGGDGIEHLNDATAISDVDFTRLGDDILISAYPSVHRDR